MKFADEVSEAFTVRLLNVRVPVLDMDEPLSMVTVPDVGAKIAFTVNAPAILNDAVGCVPGVPDIVSPLNVSVPELDMDQVVPVNVMVPDVGERFFELFTVKVPAILNEAVG